MKAVIKHAREYASVGVFEVEQPPSPTGNEVLVKIHSAALCGSDIHAYEWVESYQTYMKVPVVLGHEGSGTVEAIGDKVTGFKVGDRVMGESNIYCGNCRSCRTGDTNLCSNNLMRGVTTDGVMREYTIWSEKSLHHLPDNVDFPEGAAAQAATVSAHGVLGRINIKPGDKLLVSGVGIIGIAAAQLARSCGGTVLISGTNADEASRLPIARKLGFETINCQKEDLVDGVVHRMGGKVDYLIECSGAAPALLNGFDATRKGGSILYLGLPDRPIEFPFPRAVRGEINIIASYTSSWIDYERTLDLMRTGQLNLAPLITNYPLEKTPQAFEDGVKKTVGKPVLQFIC